MNAARFHCFPGGIDQLISLFVDLSNLIYHESFAALQFITLLALGLRFLDEIGADEMETQGNECAEGYHG
ncbi:MAG TPA: hypothetical protein VFT72_01255 [Opitutaceae bacterium]|nr:hypothetical protein [Opitutaceae bacterium]